MIILDNVNTTVLENLKNTIKKDSKISIAAACFSIYAYQKLKKELNEISEMQFIFTSPTFIKEKANKAQKEFYIPKIQREKSLYGTEFEVKLKNELTQKAIAKECAEWIKSKACFKSNITQDIMMGFLNVDQSTYTPFNNFTTVDLGCERGNNAYYPVHKTESFENSEYYLKLFRELWNDKNKLAEVTDVVIESITEAYKENSPEFIYFFTLYNIFSEFLEDISEDELPNEATGFKESKIWNTLYDFQKDAALGIINKLERYNGCILADSVGLGKTFTALAVIKYYENRNKSVLVLCPKKLSDNWNTYKGNYINNPIADDRLRYDVLYHTDLSRDSGISNGINLERLNWGNYDLVVIDESHNFRNGGRISGDDKENRYLRLLNKVIKQGVKTKVLMLSATPVNNRFQDLKNQLALAYEGDNEIIDSKLDLDKSIDDIFRQAQTVFNKWAELPVEEKVTRNLLKKLNFDFFELLDSVTIARSRKHIENYYEASKIGGFPIKLKPISKRPELTDLKSAISYNEIYDLLSSLNLTCYTPSNHILPSRMKKYLDLTDDTGINLTQQGREAGIRRLTRINLLKRLESSVYSFRLTVDRMKKLVDDIINKIELFRDKKSKIVLSELSNVDDFDDDDLNMEYFTVGKTVGIDLADMDYLSWLEELKQDQENLEMLSLMIQDINPEHDSKLQSLYKLIDEKINKPINDGNNKILIFTAFADTADYLYEHISNYAMDKFGIHSAKITGSIEGKTTIPNQKADFNTVLTLFSPLSKGKELLANSKGQEIDILIATDCISEGQNLQDCDFLVNYDIHWNPVRIIQRFGRIDRIGSKNEVIQLVNFWPDIDLDEYINLKARVETRMKISVLTSTGDENPLSPEEIGDLEYRKAQLKRLQEEVVDIEDMSSGISIMDLGLNEYRMDLLEYTKKGVDFEKTPTGLHAVVKQNESAPEGTIFILKNVNDRINKDSRNRIHPFYMVYISDEGELIINHLSPKEMLDTCRHLCKGKNEADLELCKKFNTETKDGKNMSKYSNLLEDAISSIIDVKNESELDNFLEGKEMSFLSEVIEGLNDFELISFLVIKNKE